MKAAILCMFLVCVMGANIQASMMSSNSGVEEIVQKILENDMAVWLPEELEQIGGLNEENIHNAILDYSKNGWPVTGEMLSTHDYVTRFDANKDGLVDKSELVKLIKWFVRAIYVGSKPAEKLISNNMQALVDAVNMYDENGDGVMDKNEIVEGMDELAFEIGAGRGENISGYLEDYDTDSNGLLDRTERNELIKRFVRDYYS